MPDLPPASHEPPVATSETPVSIAVGSCARGGPAGGGTCCGGRLRQLASDSTSTTARVTSARRPEPSVLRIMPTILHLDPPFDRPREILLHARAAAGHGVLAEAGDQPVERGVQRGAARSPV